jgi:type IV pilus assembly protein PilA
LRRFRADEQGFTMIELIVVILIIGVLAEIAIPSFLGQTVKAHDAAAKSAVDTARTAIETYRVDHGDYCGADPAGLVAIEPALAGVTSLQVSPCPGGDKGAYALSVQSDSGVTTVYTLAVQSSLVQRTCSPAGQGGCRSDGSW